MRLGLCLIATVAACNALWGGNALRYEDAVTATSAQTTGSGGEAGSGGAAGHGGLGGSGAAGGLGGVGGAVGGAGGSGLGGGAGGSPECTPDMNYNTGAMCKKCGDNWKVCINGHWENDCKNETGTCDPKTEGPKSSNCPNGECKICRMDSCVWTNCKSDPLCP